MAFEEARLKISATFKLRCPCIALRFKWPNVRVAGVFLLILANGWLLADQPSGQRQPIDKIYFLVHPLVYNLAARDPKFPRSNQPYIDYEARISSRWYEAIARMGPREALVVGCPPPTRTSSGCPEELVRFVESHLGPRGLVIRDVLTLQPELWEHLTDDAKIGLGHDLMAMFWKYGWQWTSDLLGQPVVARGWAERVKQTFKDRGLAFDRAAVQTFGWGESFEGCVANYGRYLGAYLDLTHPVEENFDMTVPDAPFLLNAKFEEKIPLGHDVRLFIWEGDDGRKIAYFQNAMAKIGEPTVYAQFLLGQMRLEVRSKLNQPLWPKRETSDTPRQKSIAAWEMHRREIGSTIREDNGRLTVPIPTPFVPEAAYIFADHIAVQDFRATLMHAVLTEEQPNQQ